jgi:hypothetical protein
MLLDRLQQAKAELSPVAPQYCIAWENPDHPDDCMKITHPAPEWLACAIAGNILPPVQAYHDLKFGCWVNEKYEFETHNEQAAQAWCRANKGQYEITNGHVLHEKTIPAMTEIEAMEYLVQKDIPVNVWATSHNRPYHYIVNRSQIPTDRSSRNAWKLKDLANV